MIPFALLLGTAFAGQFNVTPTRVKLDDAHQTALLALTNTGSTPLRFQVTAVEWSRDGLQDTMEALTDDVVVFPSLLTLAPGESRRIRVGTTVGARETENSYRLFVDELPALDDGNKLGITVLTRASVPVFVSPLESILSPSLVEVAIVDGEFGFGVANDGNAHFKLDTVSVVAEAADGTALFSREERGGYVLPANIRPYLYELPEGVCKQVTTTRLKGVTGEGPFDAAFPVDPSCLP